MNSLHDQIDELRKAAFKLTPAAQFRLASFVAENVGYVLGPDPLRGGPDESCAPAQSPWRPIDTAPRDGTPVLLWAEMWEMTWGAQVGSYSELECMWETSEGRVQDNEIGFDPDAEFDEHEFDEDSNLGPTHWMPIPTPPHTSTDGKGGAA